jgi:hypothetical protein
VIKNDLNVARYKPCCSTTHRKNNGCSFTAFFQVYYKVFFNAIPKPNVVHYNSTSEVSGSLGGVARSHTSALQAAAGAEGFKGLALLRW